MRDEIRRLREAVAELVGEVKSLSGRVQGLAELVGSRGRTAGPDTEAGPVSAGIVASPRSRRQISDVGAREVKVTIEPVPEIVMVALVESAFRQMVTVRRVTVLESSTERAVMSILVEEGTDLVADLREVLALPFSVVDQGPDFLTVSIIWAGGSGSE